MKVSTFVKETSTEIIACTKPKYGANFCVNSVSLSVVLFVFLVHQSFVQSVSFSRSLIRIMNRTVTFCRVIHFADSEFLYLFDLSCLGAEQGPTDCPFGNTETIIKHNASPSNPLIIKKKEGIFSRLFLFQDAQFPGRNQRDIVQDSSLVQDDNAQSIESSNMTKLMTTKRNVSSQNIRAQT